MSLARANCLRLVHRLKPSCAALPQTIQTHQQHLSPRCQLSQPSQARYSSDNGPKKLNKDPSNKRARKAGLESTKTSEEEDGEDNASFANPYPPITPPKPSRRPPPPSEPAGSKLNREQRRWQQKVEKHRATLRAQYGVAAGEASARVEAEVAAWEAAQLLSGRLRDARMVGKRTAAARRALERKAGGDRRTRRDFARILATAQRVVRKASRYVAQHGTPEEAEAWAREVDESGWLVDVEPLPSPPPRARVEEGDVGYGDEGESGEDVEMGGEEEVDTEGETERGVRTKQKKTGGGE
ncbi:hypothetical protein F4775DRAFT_71751 [Biscogniauxia sp. FL1348]|nr:hypothetical protein F4775DRAFT_71751 [Biscogniauxia sp. FL1348]